MKPLVVILMGSPADREHSGRIADACSRVGLDAVIRIG